MVEKALASDADAVFLDLEDAVAPDEQGRGPRGCCPCARGARLARSSRDSTGPTPWTRLTSTGT